MFCFRRHFDTIVDIGCGTGNITDELALKLPHSQVIGVDINESMVEFAAAHYERPSVKYLAADICEEWDQLNAKLQLTENSVDLIVSIYCLHWVSDLDQAIKNINKLLKPGFNSSISKWNICFYSLLIFVELTLIKGGYCYILLFSWSDLLPVQQRMALMDEWQQYFFAIPKNCNNPISRMHELN